jgi:rfaE bifunctional protein kinase chain/domain
MQRFSSLKILVIGDLILDRYVWGHVRRVSPEAPVPIVGMERQTYQLGGAANVAENILALGGHAEVIGVVGRDAEADQFKDSLNLEGLGTSGLVTDYSRPTTVKTRILSMSQQLLRLDQETTDPIPEKITDKLRSRVRKSIPRCDIVVLSDYLKGVLSDEFCREIIDMANRQGKQVAVDPKGYDYRKYRGAAVIKPNQHEAETATGIMSGSPDSLLLIAQKLKHQVKCKSLVMTRGAEGVLVYINKSRNTHLPPLAHSVFDVTGAGDTFMAAMTLGLASGASITDAARLGNYAGSIVVGKLGAATVTVDEIGKLAKQENT